MDHDETQFDMLPAEMVLMIMNRLPLSDLKSMSCTNKRYKALADRVITKRHKVYLCLNKRIGSVQQQHLQLKEPLTIIEPSVVETSERRYRNVSMIFLREDVSWQLTTMMEMILSMFPITKVHITGTHPTTVLAILDIGSLNRTITTLSVYLFPNKRRYDPTLQYCYTPQLQTLIWTERHCEPPLRPSQRMMLVTPRLRSLRLITGFKVSPRLLAYEGPASNKMYIDYQYLEKLFVVLNSEVRESLLQQVLPKLELFECTVPSSPVPNFWTQLRRCMPNLATLRMRSMNDVWTAETFAGLGRLRSFVLHGGWMEFASGSLFEMSDLRNLCLVHCRLPPEHGMIQFPALESLCLVESYRGGTTLSQDWYLPRLRYLCIEAPGVVGVNLRSCSNLEYIRLIVKAPMHLPPTQMTLNNLTTLQLECRFPDCQDMVGLLLARAPNLKKLMLLTHGCNLDSLRDLTRCCPQLQSVTIMAARRPLLVNFDILRTIFSLPAVEEIVLGTMTVIGIDTPIAIPRQLRTLIVQVLFCGLGELPMFTIDEDHPAAENIVIHPYDTSTFRYYTVNDAIRKSHLRCMNRSTPFRCNHVKYAFSSWLAPTIDSEGEIRSMAKYH